VAFSDPFWQLPAYLEMMERCGFAEQFFPDMVNTDDRRIWRGVPNRKWYADKKGSTDSSKEVVLFHRLARKVG
jgi:hypothetical protein